MPNNCNAITSRKVKPPIMSNSILVYVDIKCQSGFEHFSPDEVKVGRREDTVYVNADVSWRAPPAATSTNGP